METLSQLAGSNWLRFQALATVVYVLLTVRRLFTRKRHWTLAAGMGLLLLFALVSPFAGLAHPSFWSFLLASAVLWGALFWYEGRLVLALQQNNPGAIAYLVPVMAWGFSLPLAGIMHWLMS